MLCDKCGGNLGICDCLPTCPVCGSTVVGKSTFPTSTEGLPEVPPAGYVYHYCHNKLKDNGMAFMMFMGKRWVFTHKSHKWIEYDKKVLEAEYGNLH